jgi:hypothetical protein
VPSERGPQGLADPSPPRPPAATPHASLTDPSLFGALTSGDDRTPLDCRVDCVDILLCGMYESAAISVSPSRLNRDHASQPRRIIGFSSGAGGVAVRNRSIRSQQEGSGLVCPDTTDQLTCNTAACTSSPTPGPTTTPTPR